MANIIPLSPTEVMLKRSIRAHMKGMGFVRNENGILVPPDLTKDTYRIMHHHHRLQKLEKNKIFLEKYAHKLIEYLASGSDVVPKNILPRIEMVPSDSWQSDLFRFATLFWRVPVSEGYGRRMRFLVWDDSNDKLIGIFALGDAVFNLKVRDELIGWDHKQRSETLVDIMDAYVLGALPPYNQLLGGKLVACLLKSEEVRKCFKQRYGSSTGIISGKAKNANLVMVTTTSSLGKSSIYNRLKIGDERYLDPIGFTSGFGHFHIPDKLFNQMREYLEEKGDSYSDNFKFGNGPNWRLRTIRKVFNMLNMPDSLINHGLKREVFATQLATNAFEVLRGECKRPSYNGLLSVSKIGELARERWIDQRAINYPEYMGWKKEDFLKIVTDKTKLICGTTTLVTTNGLRKK